MRCAPSCGGPPCGGSLATPRSRSSPARRPALSRSSLDQARRSRRCRTRWPPGRAPSAASRVVVGLVAPCVDARRSDRGEPFAQRRPAPFQQADARLGRQVAEERQPHAEPGVLGSRCRPGVSCSSSRNALLTFVGDAVDGLAAAAAWARRLIGLDRAVALEATQRRVERAVGDPPETAERRRRAPGRAGSRAWAAPSAGRGSRVRTSEVGVPSRGRCDGPIYRAHISLRYIYTAGREPVSTTPGVGGLRRIGEDGRRR